MTADVNFSSTGTNLSTRRRKCRGCIRCKSLYVIVINLYVTTKMGGPFRCRRGTPLAENADSRVTTVMKWAIYYCRGSISPQNTGFYATTAIKVLFCYRRGTAGAIAAHRAQSRYC